MIVGLVNPRIVALRPDRVTLQAGSIRYAGMITLHFYERYKDQVGSDRFDFIPCQMRISVNQSSVDQRLYVFADDEEEALFDMLTSVKGVGPTSAMKIISGSNSALSLKAGIEQGDVAALSRIKGIGKKTAERILFELRGLVVTDEQGVGLVGEAAMALRAMGFKDPQKAVRKVLEEIGTTGNHENDVNNVVLAVLKAS